MHMLIILKICNWNGNNKEKIDKNKEKKKEIEGKLCRKILELSKENGRLKRDNLKEKNKNKKEKKIN